MTTRLTRCVALAVVALLGVAVAATAAPGRRPSCAGVDVLGGWKKVTAPLPARAFAVHERAGIVVAGDGGIMSSRDGGCKWASLYELTAAATGERFAALASTGDTLVAATSALRVLVSRDAGATWELGGRGLEVPGEPVGLYASQGSSVVYLVARQNVSDQMLPAAGVPEQGAGVVATVLYRSGDGGATWERRGAPALAYTGPHGTGVAGALAPGSLWDLAADPDDPDHLLAAARGGVFRSTDAGASWTRVAGADEAEVRTVSIAPGGTAAVAVDPRSGTLFETFDVAAGRWSTSVHPQLRTEMMLTYPNAAPWAWSVFGADGAALLSGAKGIFRRGSDGLADLTPPHATAALADVQVVGGAPWARAWDGSAIFTAVTDGGAGSLRPDVAGAPAGRPDGTGGRSVPGVSVPPVRPGAARLEPAVREVSLDPGESRTITYEARLEPQPVAVDVYFLVDTTSSMGATLRSLTLGIEDIVGRLARSGIRLRAGVGAFRSYPRETDRRVEDYPYRRIRALGPVDDELVRSLYELEGAGSSGANLTALYQAVTGAGQDVLPPGPSKADVPSGLGAGFRDDATKVVVHFADTWFGTPERGDPNGYYAPGTWPGPGFTEVAAALRAESIHHLGVAMQPSAGGTVLTQADVRDDLELLSRQTLSLAGERGADCDGDGNPDVARGAALVCPLERDAGAAGLAAVVTGLVQALEHEGSVSLVERGPRDVVSAIVPAAYPDLDLRASHTLAFDVSVSCTRAEEGTTRTTRLSLRVGATPVDAATVRVICNELPPVVPVAPPEPPVPAIAPIPAPPPPPHSVPGLGPGSVTAPAPVQAPAPAQVTGGQPQSALVAQRRQQPQLAFVAAAQQVRSQTGMQHAMVRTVARDPLASAKAWTATGALTLLWGWGLATALAAGARAPVRRRRV
ncbi:MAG TPA: hypothetical protein VG318_18920 [Actinomycetota bacterium]|nr:hypothetical protein [Actinomycetota bacterium]